MTKNQTQARYIDRLNRVDDYVFANLEAEISFDRLAEIACLSPYHWSRIYSAMRGETIVATVRRLRLQRAADRLANSDADITEIATRAGYGSTETFGRAFKDAFEKSPAAYREAGSHAKFSRAKAADAGAGFSIEIVTLAERRCAGIDHRGSYMEIDHAMGRLFSELVVRQAVPEVPEMIGLFFDDPDLGPETELRARACLPIAQTVTVDAPLVETHLRGGLYARLNYTGPYADMRSAYRWLLGTWLPRSGYEPDDAPIFEAYLNDPRVVPQNQLRTDIHLPLRDRP
ncbi:AraC family transcriptional regulator [Pelagibacterium sp.]|uniref:AraC family transcriptional regulator n=1 Tax=Pelagibacterium sp. TaxID=1967288 RepID=UPI003A92207D